MCAVKDQLSRRVCRGQHLDDEAPEQARKNAHRQEKTRTAGDPALAIGGKTAARRCFGIASFSAK
jgi:hypothetical protein